MTLTRLPVRWKRWHEMRLLVPSSVILSVAKNPAVASPGMTMPIPFRGFERGAAPYPASAGRILPARPSSLRLTNTKRTTFQSLSISCPSGTDPAGGLGGRAGFSPPDTSSSRHDNAGHKGSGGRRPPLPPPPGMTIATFLWGVIGGQRPPVRLPAGTNVPAASQQPPFLCRRPRTAAVNLRRQHQTRVRGVQRGRIAGRPLCQGVRGTASPASPAARHDNSNVSLGGHRGAAPPCRLPAGTNVPAATCRPQPRPRLAATPPGL